MHTPGPWAVSGNYVRKRHGSEHGHKVAWICGDGPQPEWIPNAHLISAAPELLAALEGIVGAWGEHWVIDYTDIEDGLFQKMELAKAAIAKAKGETP